jgi:hypothetical protein
MTKSKSGDLHIPEIRALAARFSAEQIERCIELTLQRNDNPCIAERDLQEAMNVLAKAEFVKAQIERGMTQQEAMRELGRRIRAMQGD